MENLDKPLSSQIMEIVKTKEEAARFVEDLKKLADSLFNAKSDFEQALKKNIPFPKKEKLLEMLKNNNIDKNNFSQMQEFLSLLLETIEKMPVLTIKIGFEPREETIENISEWLQLKLGKNILLEAEVDKNIIAGALISYNGAYKDYSLKNKIDKKYLEHN